MKIGEDQKYYNIETLKRSLHINVLQPSEYINQKGILDQKNLWIRKFKKSKECSLQK